MHTHFVEVLANAQKISHLFRNHIAEGEDTIVRTMAILIKMRRQKKEIQQQTSYGHYFCFVFAPLASANCELVY